MCRIHANNKPKLILTIEMRRPNHIPGAVDAGTLHLACHARCVDRIERHSIRIPRHPIVCLVVAVDGDLG